MSRRSLGGTSVSAAGAAGVCETRAHCGTWPRFGLHCGLPWDGQALEWQCRTHMARKVFVYVHSVSVDARGGAGVSWHRGMNGVAYFVYVPESVFMRRHGVSSYGVCCLMEHMVLFERSAGPCYRFKGWLQLKRTCTRAGKLPQPPATAPGCMHLAHASCLHPEEPLQHRARAPLALEAAGGSRGRRRRIQLHVCGGKAPPARALAASNARRSSQRAARIIH